MTWFNGNVFQSYIGPIATYLSLLTFIFSLYVSVKITFGRRWAIRNQIKKLLENPGRDPAALIVDCIGKGAAVDAKKHLATLDVPSDRVITLDYSNTYLKPESIPEFLCRFRNKQDELAAMGADRIYLFISAPMPIVSIVGAELANFGRIILMHWNNQGGIYENWGPLRFRS